jgi:hypothetical protein
LTGTKFYASAGVMEMRGQKNARLVFTKPGEVIERDGQSD